MRNIDYIALTIFFACAASVFPVANMQAATQIVDSTADTNTVPLSCVTGGCGLRQAINVANSGDTIVFSSLFNTPQTITLLPANGLLLIDKILTISGPGSDLLTIVGDTYAFEIDSGESGFLSGMTITGGSSGGILNHGGLTLEHCTVSGNNGPGIVGGVSVVVDTSTITENTGTFAGGISDGLYLFVWNSTISNNTATWAFGNVGGGISFGGSVLEIINSTISGNVVPNGFNNGGGIQIHSIIIRGTIENSTITGNSATGAGGIFLNAASLNPLEIGNTIVADNLNNSTTPDVAGTFVSLGYNLIGNVGSAIGFPFLGDLTGTGAAPVDPMLDPLDDYGGPTETHRPQTGSPAIDKGYSFGSGTDQRGFRRPMDDTGIPPATGGDNSDKGAVELRQLTVVFGVVRGPLGDPLRNAQILLVSDTDRMLRATTDASGRYRFRRVPTFHTYQLSAMYRQYEFTPEVVMVAEEPVRVDFTAQP